MRNVRYLIVGCSLVLMLILFPARGHAAILSDVINTLNRALAELGMTFWLQEGVRFRLGGRVTAPATSDPSAAPKLSFWSRAGSVPAGTPGTIVSLPRTVGGAVWWKVLYDNGVFGWIRESDLTAAPQGVGLVVPQTSVAEGTPGVPGAAGTPDSSQSGYGPTLISINPSSLSALQPVTFTITGSNFQQGAVIVYSGPSSGTIATEFESSTRLRVSVPGGLLAGSYSARVRNPDGRESGSATVTATSAQTDPNTPVSAELVDIKVEKLPWPRGLGDDDPAWTFYINPQEGNLYFWTFARMLALVDSSSGYGGYRTVSWKEVPRIRINYMNWLTYRRTAVYQSPDGELNGAASGPLQPPGVGITLANAAPAIFYSQNPDAEFEKYLDEVRDYVLSRGLSIKGTVNLNGLATAAVFYPLVRVVEATETSILEAIKDTVEANTNNPAIVAQAKRITTMSDFSVAAFFAEMPAKFIAEFKEMGQIEFQTLQTYANHPEVLNSPYAPLAAEALKKGATAFQELTILALQADNKLKSNDLDSAVSLISDMLTKVIILEGRAGFVLDTLYNSAIRDNDQGAITLLETFLFYKEAVDQVFAKMLISRTRSEAEPDLSNDFDQIASEYSFTAFDPATAAIIEKGIEAQQILFGKMDIKVLIALALLPGGNYARGFIWASDLVADILASFGVPTSKSVLGNLKEMLEAQALLNNRSFEEEVGRFVAQTEQAIAAGEVLDGFQAAVARSLGHDVYATSYGYVASIPTGYTPPDGNFGGTPNFSLIYSGPDANVQAP